MRRNKPEEDQLVTHKRRVVRTLSVGVALAGLLLLGHSAIANTVTFPEGYGNVPDWMNDVSAAENNNLPPEVKQFRAFSGTDPSEKTPVVVFFYVVDYRLTLRDLKALAGLNQEDLKAQTQRFIGQGFSAGTTIKVEHMGIDLLAQRMTATLSCSANGKVFKGIVSAVPISGQRLLKAEIYVDERHYPEQVGTMTQVAASVTAFPEYQLVEEK
jgi:hypothetical protein